MLLNCAGLCGLLACDLSMTDVGPGQLQVSVMHHSSPRNGSFVERDERLVFETDLGWSIQLTTAHITTSAVAIETCSGTALDVEMRWGSVKENLLDEDFRAVPMAAGTYESTSVCSVRLIHHAEDGPTIALGGYAEKSGERVKFYVESSRRVRVDLDVREYNAGKALKFTPDPGRATVLVVSHTYDRFFDGIDFRDLDDLDLEPVILDTLALESRVGIGEHVEASFYDELPPLAHSDPDDDTDGDRASSDEGDSQQDPEQAGSDTADDPQDAETGGDLPEDMQDPADG